MVYHIRPCLEDENDIPLQEAALMVWDSSKAREATREINLLESIVPHDRKESALKLFHDNNYQINAGTLIFFISCFSSSLPRRWKKRTAVGLMILYQCAYV